MTTTGSEDSTTYAMDIAAEVEVGVMPRNNRFLIYYYYLARYFDVTDTGRSIVS